MSVKSKVVDACRFGAVTIVALVVATGAAAHGSSRETQLQAADARIPTVASLHAVRAVDPNYRGERPGDPRAASALAEQINYDDGKRPAPTDVEAASSDKTSATTRFDVSCWRPRRW